MKELAIKIQKLLGLTADGIIGPKSLAAIAAKVGASTQSSEKETIKAIQTKVGAKADGILGVNTLNAILTKLGGNKPTPVDPLIQKYINKPIVYTKVAYKAKPVPQSVVRSNKSAFGRAGNENYLVNVPVPSNYPLRYDGKIVKTIRVHNLVADRLKAALQDIINHYGEDIEKVAPGACIYDGSYYFRNSRGGSSTSIHSWGLALDFDAAKSPLKASHTTARLAQPIYKPFFDIFEHHGFLSLGRRNDYDWQHVQCTLWG